MTGPIRSGCNVANRVIAHRGFIPGCLFLAIFLRLLWVWWIDAPQVKDFFWYELFARNIADGKGYSVDGVPTGYWPIGYPGLLGAVFYVAGGSVLAGKILNVVLDIATIVLTFRISQELFHADLGARLTLCLLCFYPNHIAYTALLSSEILFVFLVASSSYVFVTAQGRARFLLLSGMLWGLTALTKPQALVLPILFLLFFSTNWRSLLKSGLVVYCAILLTVSPWLVRNKTVFGAYTLAHTGGINLLDGNNRFNDTGTSGFDDRVNALLGDLRTVPLHHMFDGKEVARDARARDIAIDYIVLNPARVFALIPRKFTELWRWDTEGIAFSLGTMQSAKGPLKKAYENFSQVSQWYYDLILLLFLVSLPMTLRRPLRPRHIGLAVIISLTLVYLALFGEPRYHFAMMPWLAIYAGLGAQGLLLGPSSLRMAGAAHAAER